MGADSRPLRLACYGFAVSLSSAILLRLEITAGRLIAPCVGVTLYCWASIFGVFLAGLLLRYDSRDAAICPIAGG